MPHATLRARVSVIAATTTLTIVGVFAATATASTTSATTTPPTTAAAVAPPMSLAAPKPAAHRAHKTNVQIHEALVRKVLREARRQKGKPYVYGGAGPRSFDCSGLVRYVFMHSVGRVLPHNAAAQYYAVRHIRRSSLQPGDLVFTDNGYISHVGIYAGHHHWWVAPQTGTNVQLQRIYRAHFLYGRVLVIHKHIRHRRAAKHHHHTRHHHKTRH